jgi:hypothetical protein
VKRKNILGWVLVLCGAVSLIFGWPWGSLVGALLVLAGVLTFGAALLQQPQVLPMPQPPTPAQSKPLTPAPKDASVAEAEKLIGVIEDLEGRGGVVPQELIDRLKQLTESGLESWFKDYDALISNGWSKIVDLSAIAQQVRSQHGWPDRGSILGHPAASEQLDFFLTRIETLGGKVPLPEAIFLQAVLDQGEGPEARYLKERQKRGYPSLYANDPHIEWAANPGFYERQLQRRHNNVLFPPPKRDVSRQDLYVARQLDAEESKAFEQSWVQFIHTTREKLSSTSTVSQTVDLLKDLYDLIEKGTLIGGELAAKVNQSIREIYGVVLAQMYEAFKDDPEATKTLTSAEEALWAGSDKTVLNPFIAQAARIGDPADYVPALLTEDLETIRSSVEMLHAGGDSGAVEALRARVLQMIQESPEARQVLRQQPMKLEAFRIASD